MMVTSSTLLTSKGLIFFITAFSLLAGCASSSIEKIKESTPSLFPNEVKDQKEEVKKRKILWEETRPSVIDGSPTQSGPFFQDRTQSLGLEGVKATRTYAIDFNSDGLTDLVFLEDHFSHPRFFQFVGEKNHFKEVHPKYSPRIRASFLNFVDLDKDGVLDILWGSFNQGRGVQGRPLSLFRGRLNRGKISYELVDNSLGADWSFASVTAFDFNLDGMLDLFFPTWFSPRSQEVTPDRLYQGHFFQFRDNSGALINEGKYEGTSQGYVHATPSFSSSTCDVNQDGLPDLLTTSTHRYPNKLWVQQVQEKGPPRYENQGVSSRFASDAKGKRLYRGGGHSLFALCHDYNQDGLVDVFVGEASKVHDPPDKDRSAILSGTSQTSPLFYRTQIESLEHREKDRSDRRAIWIDLNFDGRDDLLLENSGLPRGPRFHVFIQAQDHSFRDQSKSFGLDVANPSGVVILDFNQDGRPDLLIGQTSLRTPKLKRRVYLFENRTPWRGKRVVKVKLLGKKSNPQAIGARIEMKTSSRTQSRWVEFSSGHLPSQNENYLFFGLSKGERPLSMKVIWPYRKGPGEKNLETNLSLKSFSFQRFLSLAYSDEGVVLNQN